MPSVSKKQARLMAACAHGADYDSCPPAKVSKEFNQADKGRNLADLPNRVERKATGGEVYPRPFRW